jgi:hypothetical protein
MDLVILDELGDLVFSQIGVALLFHLPSKVHEHTSAVITTHLPLIPAQSQPSQTGSTSIGYSAFAIGSMKAPAGRLRAGGSHRTPVVDEYRGDVDQQVEVDEGEETGTAVVVGRQGVQQRCAGSECGTQVERDERVVGGAGGEGGRQRFHPPAVCGADVEPVGVAAHGRPTAEIETGGEPDCTRL